MAMVHAHSQLDWYLGMASLSLSMPCGGTPLCPMTVVLVMVLCWALALAGAAPFCAWPMPLVHPWCAPWGWPLEATGVALMMALGCALASPPPAPPPPTHPPTHTTDTHTTHPHTVRMAIGCGWPWCIVHCDVWLFVCMGVAVCVWGGGGWGGGGDYSATWA